MVARIPFDVAALAAQRGCLPAGVPILKRIGAVAPQSVCVCEHVVSVNGAVIATVRLLGGEHRPIWSQCGVFAEYTHCSC